MATKTKFALSDITRANKIFSATRTTIETAFYGNNVREVTTVADAYTLAAQSPKVIVTDQPILHTDELGLPPHAKMLVDNHGAIVGRTAAARHFINNPAENPAALNAILREAIYNSHQRSFFKTSVMVGLDEDFMLKSHLLLPSGYEFNLLSYLLNFQAVTAEYTHRYQRSVPYNEGDIYLYCDPEWHDDRYPQGLVIIDAEHNAAAVLGLRYFGELKKTTLTLAWATAHRNGYTASHGGEKAIHFSNKADKVLAFYGLSGSGKSSLTHAKHDGKFAITVLHDDAFVISREDGSSVALEPAYFDKTNDYLPGSKEAEYFTTVMNVGVTLDVNGQKTLVTEDLRNGNGRTIKSRYASTNRVDKESAPITDIFWIMKDDSLPPVLRLNDPITATTFGITLATKRSSAENVDPASRDALVIEPFANPFRAYPLSEDYHDFKELFTNHHVNCYIVNTDSFGGRDIPKEVTLGILEDIIADQKTDLWRPFGNLPHISYLPLTDYSVDFTNQDYCHRLKTRLEIRLQWLQDYAASHPHENLPSEIKETLMSLIANV